MLFAAAPLLVSVIVPLLARVAARDHHIKIGELRKLRHQRHVAAAVAHVVIVHAAPRAESDAARQDRIRAVGDDRIVMNDAEIVSQLNLDLVADDADGEVVHRQARVRVLPAPCRRQRPERSWSPVKSSDQTPLRTFCTESPSGGRVVPAPGPSTVKLMR